MGKSGIEVTQMGNGGRQGGRTEPMEKAVKRAKFVGRYRHTVDEKRRLAIPKKWREEAGSKSEFYVLPLPNNHLLVLPEAAMERMLEKADEISIGEYDRRDAMRLVIGRTHTTGLDAQGRLLLSEDLMTYAGLEGEEVLVGMLKGFEIWSPARLEAVHEKGVSQFAELVKELGM